MGGIFRVGVPLALSPLALVFADAFAPTLPPPELVVWPEPIAGKTKLGRTGGAGFKFVKLQLAGGEFKRGDSN